MFAAVKNILLFISLSIMLYSCAGTKGYLPEATYAPILRNGGDLKATVSTKLQTDGNTNKLDISPSIYAAFSPVNHLGIMAFYQHTKRGMQETSGGTFWSTNTNYLYKADRFSVATGYYHSSPNHFHSEIYLGYSKGNFEKNFLDTSVNVFKNNYEQWFAQPALAFFLHDNLNVAFGVKAIYQKTLSYNAADTSVLREITTQHKMASDYNYSFINPFIQLNIGGPYLKFFMQEGFNWCVSNPKLVGADFPFYINMGATFEISKIYSPITIKKIEAR